MSSDSTSPPADREQFIRAVTSEAFADWRTQTQIKENLREGNAWRHTPASVTSPSDHSPHRLTQCHRQTYYTAHNAPKEDHSPDGVFWAGSRIEEDRVQPFLEDVATTASPEAYVQNSMWVDYEREVVTDTDPPTVLAPDSDTDPIDTSSETGIKAGTTVRFRGETDPVICTRMGDPLLPTEVKTRESLDSLDRDDPTPSPHHKAQLHAYLVGLDQSVPYPVDQGLVIYVDRTHHDLEAIPIEFDSTFWRETVCQWAATQTRYRLDEELPPADPTYGWECEYCSYRTRCGKASDVVADAPPTEFVPLTRYPRDRVVTAIEAEGGASALTPTIARQYPELSENHSVDLWTCPVCGQEFAWDARDWDVPIGEGPPCPACAEQHQFVALHPRPDQ